MFFRHEITLFWKIFEKNLRICIPKREIFLSKWINRLFPCICHLWFLSKQNKQLLPELCELKNPMCFDITGSSFKGKLLHFLSPWIPNASQRYDLDVKERTCVLRTVLWIFYQFLSSKIKQVKLAQTLR